MFSGQKPVCSSMFPVQQVQAGCPVHLGLHQQVRAAGRSRAVHGADDPRHVLRAGAGVGLADASDLLEGRQVPARGLLVPE
jgi:hypothetical protein